MSPRAGGDDASHHSDPEEGEIPAEEEAGKCM
jgi:hypothetical protein